MSNVFIDFAGIFHVKDEGLMEGPNVPNDYFFFSSLLAKRVNHCLRHLHLVEI